MRTPPLPVDEDVEGKGLLTLDAQGVERSLAAGAMVLLVEPVGPDPAPPLRLGDGQHPGQGFFIRLRFGNGGHGAP